MGLISVKDYAAKHGKSPITIRQSCHRGRFKTAQKIGRDWLIDENEPFVDNRFQSKEK